MLGAAGYFGYQNRREIQTWDRKLLSAIAVGVAAFFGAEGYVLFFLSFWQVRLTCSFPASSCRRMLRSSSSKMLMECGTEGSLWHDLFYIDSTLVM